MSYIPHPRQRAQLWQLTWIEDLVILVRRGLYQLTMATIMLYNNHHISLHITINIYLALVLGAQLGANCLKAGFGWSGLALLLLSHPFSRTSRLVRECFIAWRQKQHKSNSPNVQGLARSQALHFNLLLTSSLPKYHWSKQVIWPSPELKVGEKHSIHRRKLQSDLAKNVDI